MGGLYFVSLLTPTPSSLQAKMTSWNVRVREDTAKYLLNLDVESAFYDPKTRSMRENPFEGSGKDPAAFVYAGDNAWRNRCVWGGSISVLLRAVY